MKKILYTLLLGTAVMACSKESVEYEAPDTEISLVPVTRVAQTKGSAIEGSTMPTTETLMIYGYYDTDVTSLPTSGTIGTDAFATQYIPGATFKNESGTAKWAGDPVSYYWPKTGSIIFSGYTPTDFSSKLTYAVGTNQFSLGEYTQPTLDQTKDLLYACYDKPYTASKAGTAGVSMKFHHALTYVTFLFKTKNESDANSFVVNSVVFEKLANKASEATFAAPAKGNPSNATWTISSESDAYKDFTFYENTTGTTLTNTATEIASTTQSGLFIPETLGNNVKLVVKFKMKQNNSSDAPYLDQTYSVQLNTLKAAGEAITEWKAGYHYIYTLTFGQNVIEVTPIVTGWTAKEISIEP